MRVLKKCLWCLVIISIFIATSGLLFRVHQKPLVAEDVVQATGLSFKIEDIPRSNKRPGNKRQIQYIVIHNTANGESSAQNERDYLVNPNNISSTSFHLVVDENEVIQAVPVNEVAFHAGDRLGNRQGIGIEICESGNFEQTKQNAAKIVAYLMKTYDIPLSHVKTHQDFSGKNCPRKMLGDWESFLKQIQKAYEALV